MNTHAYELRICRWDDSTSVKPLDILYTLLSAPRPARNVQCSNPTVTSVRVTWDPPIGSPPVFDVYMIYRSQNGGARTLVCLRFGTYSRPIIFLSVLLFTLTDWFQFWT